MLDAAMKKLRTMSVIVASVIPLHGLCADLTVNFTQNQIVSFVTTATKPGAEEGRRRYDEKMAEFASPLGFKREGTLQITGTRAGDYVPDPVLIIYSWPDRASVQKFNSTAEAAEMHLAQKDIWDELRINNVTIPQDVEITFRSDKIYRVVSLWINPEYPVDFYRYRDALSQTVFQLGGQYILFIEGGDYESFIEPYRSPDLFWIIEWPDREAHQSYIGSDAFRANHQYFQSGVAKFNVFEAKLMLLADAGAYQQ